MILMEKKLLERSTKKNYKRQIKKSLEFRNSSDKLYVKWKGYNNSFHSWIDEKDIA